MMTVEEAITGRRCIRAFLPKPVPRELIERVLQIAGRAPSGSNVQPWKVWVLTGAVLDEIRTELAQRYDRGQVSPREYNYYPEKWREPYLARRRACGWGLYGTLGIGREDKDKMHAQHRRNFLFFDAPVGLIFSIDRDLEQGSWLDYGMFLQNIMVAARAVRAGDLPPGRLPDLPRRPAEAPGDPRRPDHRLRHGAGLSRPVRQGQHLRPGPHGGGGVRDVRGRGAEGLRTRVLEPGRKTKTRTKLSLQPCPR